MVTSHKNLSLSRAKGHKPQFTPYLVPPAYGQPCQPANPKGRQGMSPLHYQYGPGMEPAIGDPGLLMLPLLLTRAQQEALRVLEETSSETSVSCDPYHLHA